MASAKTRTVASLAIAAVLASCAAAASGPFAGGTGAPNDPYQIATPEQLIAVGKDPNLWDKHFVLTRDLDMKGIDPNAMSPIGRDNKPFLGVFDGKSHTIANLHMESEFEQLFALFGCVGEPTRASSKQVRAVGHVWNLHLANAYIQADCDAGGLAAMLNGGTIKNCSVSGTIRGDDMMGGTGGLIGIMFDGQVMCCRVRTVVIDEINNTGGLIGCMAGGEVAYCSSSGRVENSGRAGGLMGVAQFWDYPAGIQENEPKDISRPGVVFRCWSDCSVFGEEMVGGLIGEVLGDGKVEDCYASGAVHGRWAVGGLVGESWYSSIIRCYATGKVMGEEETGGFIGRNEMLNDADLARYPPCQLIVEKVQSPALSGGAADQKPRWRVVYRPAIQSCFWDAQASGMTRGLGTGADAQGGLTRLTTAEMRTAATFKNFGWDFEEVWTIQEGKSYPRLRWEQERPQK